MQNHDEKLSAWDSSWRKTTELVARSVQSCFKHPQNKLQHPRTAVAEAQFRKPSRAIQRQSCASMCQQGCAIHSCIRGLSLCSQLCSITVNDVLSQFNMKPQPNHAVPKDIVNSACGPLTLGFKFLVSEPITFHLETKRKSTNPCFTSKWTSFGVKR